jgi:hypothetical protein
MRKFSLISESKINDKEIESILYDSGFEYLILHDYYTDEKNDFFKELGKLKEDSTKSKIILIDSKISKSSIHIEGYNEPPFKFITSGFYTIDSIDDALEKYTKIFEVTKKLEKYSPKLVIHDGKFIITLLGEKVDSSELKLSDKKNKVMSELYSELSEFASQKGNEYIKVSKFTLSGVPSVRIDFKNTFKNFKKFESIVSRVIKTFEIHKMGDPKRKWMDEYEDIEDLDNIRDWVNGNGFYIELEQNKFASSMPSWTASARSDCSFIIKLIDF